MVITSYYSTARFLYTLFYYNLFKIIKTRHFQVNWAVFLFDVALSWTQIIESQ